jgi:hypothetical protein
MNINKIIRTCGETPSGRIGIKFGVFGGPTELSIVHNFMTIGEEV